MRKKESRAEEILTHPFEPFFDPESSVLILGSFPSVKSREQQFFYGHPKNRFWKVLAEVFGEDAEPGTIEEKRAFLHKNHLALWDVVYSCRIRGSSDSSIREAVPTELGRIIENSKVSRIFVNGKTAYGLYLKYQQKTVKLPAAQLPSTSPANAAWSAERLAEAWRIIR